MYPVAQLQIPGLTSPIAFGSAVQLTVEEPTQAVPFQAKPVIHEHELMLVDDNALVNWEQSI